MEAVDWPATVSMIAAAISAAAAGISVYYSRAAHKLERQQAARETRILALHEEESARQRSEDRRRLEEMQKAHLVPTFVPDGGNGAALQVRNRGLAGAEEVGVQLDGRPLDQHVFQFPQHWRPPAPTVIRSNEAVRYRYMPTGQDPEYVTVRLLWKDLSGPRQETFAQVSTTFHRP